MNIKDIEKIEKQVYIIEVACPHCGDLIGLIIPKGISVAERKASKPICSTCGCILCEG